ncbi:E3 ubiquitin-protein ligase TRIM56-like [Watersipora subatra]|uniref:E3 ubiquitin-protein ligase TRIM56-like n=1 Tax=Watersipora subatra TaxID=2589382 RepID=UPI00355BBA07
MSTEDELSIETLAKLAEDQADPNIKGVDSAIPQLALEGSETKCSLYELIRTELIRCTQCRDVYTYPCILPCLHSFCGSCIDKLQQVTGENLQEIVVTCPLCHCVYDVPVGGFSCNHFLCNLVELYDAQQEEDIPCTYCQYEFEETPATSRCLQCQDNLCQNCASAHRKTKITRGHILAPFDQIKLGKYDSDLRQLQKVNCNRHPLQACTKYCHNCNSLFCADCKEHERHNVVDIEDKSLTEVDLVTDLNDTINLVLPVHMEQQQSLQGLSDSLEEKHENIKEMINERADLLHKLIDSQKNVMLEDLTTYVSKSASTINEELSSVEHVTVSFSSNLELLDSLLLYGKPEEMIDLQAVLSDRLDAVNCYVPKGKSNGGLHVEYSPGPVRDECVGTIAALFGHLAVNTLPQLSPPDSMRESVCLSHSPQASIRKKAHSTPQYVPPLLMEPKLCLEFDSCLSSDSNNTWPTGVCTSATGDIAVCDRDNALIKLFSSNGIYKSSIAGEREYKLVKPFDVAGLSTGEIVVTDYGTESVKIFALAGIGRLEINGEFEYPRGVATTKDDRIVVLDSELCRVTIHSSTDGALLNIIKGQTPSTNFIDPYYICTTLQDDVIVTDFAEPNIKLLSLNGVDENSEQNYGEYGVATHQGLLQPYGCHQDGYGITLVADNRNDKISVLMPSGEFGKHLITRKHGLWKPIALCVNISGQLIVTEGLGKIKIFQYI